MRAIVIVGLPGSGKTTYAKTLGGLLVDDPFPDETPLDIALSSDEPLVVIADPMATIMTTRNHIEMQVGERQLTIVCFENDPDACWPNLERRGDGRISRKWLDRMSLSYDVDRLDPDLILPVYRA